MHGEGVGHFIRGGAVDLEGWQRLPLLVAHSDAAQQNFLVPPCKGRASLDMGGEGGRIAEMRSCSRSRRAVAAFLRLHHNADDRSIQQRSRDGERGIFGFRARRCERHLYAGEADQRSDARANFVEQRGRVRAHPGVGVEGARRRRIAARRDRVPFGGTENN